MVRVADLVIQKLIDQGIKHIFLITGRGILYLTDAVAKNKEIEGVSTYHEQGASYAAMAYALIRIIYPLFLSLGSICCRKQRGLLQRLSGPMGHRKQTLLL